MMTSPSGIQNLSGSGASARRLKFGLFALLPLSGIAAYLWIAPAKKEAELSKASLAELVRLSKKEPDNPRVFYHQGKRLNEINSLGPAYAAWARAAYLDGENEEYWLEWSDAAQRFHNLDESISICNTYLKQNPKSSKIHLALARIYQNKKVHFKGYDEAKLATQYDPLSDEAWRILGMEALTTDRTQESLGYFQTAFKLNPKKWENAVALGNMQMDGKRYSEASASFKSAIETAPKQFIAYLGLGEAQFSLAKTDRELAEAKATLRKAISLEPNTAEPRLILGQLFMAQSQWLDAKSILISASELRPNDPDIHLALSKVYRKLNDFPAANRESRLHQESQDYENQKLTLGSRTRATNDPKIRLELARLFAKHRDYAQAIDTYQNILSREENPAVRKEMESVLVLRSDNGKSPLKLRTGVSKDNVALSARLHDAEDLLNRTGFKEAEDAFRSIVASEPSCAEAYQGLGLALNAQGDREDAFRYLETAVKMNPNLDRAESALAQLYYALGFADEAGKRMSKLTKEFPDNAGYAFALGIYYGGTQSHYNDALKSFQRAVELKPNESSYRQTLADMHLKVHQIKEAETCYRKALQLAPNDPGALFGLGKFLAEHGSTPQEESEAYALLTQVDAGAKDFPPGLFQLGKLDLKRGNAKLAIVRLEKSVSANPDFESLYALARAYRLDHQEANAKAATDAASQKRDMSIKLKSAEDMARQSKKSLPLRLSLARLYAQNGMHAKAINQFEVCINLTPDNSKIKTELTQYKERLTKNGEMPSMKLFNGMVTAVVPPSK